jgi:hypothetical protein
MQMRRISNIPAAGRHPGEGRGPGFLEVSQNTGFRPEFTLAKAGAGMTAYRQAQMGTHTHTDTNTWVAGKARLRIL